MNCQYIYLSETHSTNSYLQQLCREGSVKEGTFVVADYQLAGKGQRGNSWESERGQNLTFSFLLTPLHIVISYQFILSQIISLAVYSLLSPYDDGFSIKWPNDIYWHDQKIGGILIENQLYGSHIEESVVGIGLNINQTHFLSSAPNPVSLFQITKCQHDCKALLEEFSRVFFAIYGAHHSGLLSDQDIARVYYERLYRREGVYAYQSGEERFDAAIKRVEASGHLVLAIPEGEERRYAFKEVSFLI